MKRVLAILCIVAVSALNLRAQITPKIVTADFQQWSARGATNLFAVNGKTLNVTWDSSLTNSYFYLPLGMTLNSSTLIGLLLSIGRLVDDSIIDIHSVERHLRMGKSPEDAAVDGITEVRLAVLAITLMVCVALLPLAFAGGIVQYMFEGIVWPIVFGLLASALVSFTLTPLLAAHLFAPHGTEARASRGPTGRSP